MALRDENSSAPDDDELWDTRRTGTYLRMTASGVRQLVKRGKLAKAEGLTRIGRRIFFDSSVLRERVKNGRLAVPPPKKK